MSLADIVCPEPYQWWTAYERDEAAGRGTHRQPLSCPLHARGGRVLTTTLNATWENNTVFLKLNYMTGRSIESKPGRKKRARKPSIEGLEQRELLSTIPVGNNGSGPQEVYVLDSNHSLWLEAPNWQTNGSRTLVDTTVKAFTPDPSAPGELYVLGTDGALWLEANNFQAERSRTLVDTTVQAFKPDPTVPGSLYVLGTDGALWLEADNYRTTGSRTLVDTTVQDFAPDGAAPGSLYVLGTDGALWLEANNWRQTGSRTPVDTTVQAFAVDPAPASSLYVLGTDGALWLEANNWRQTGSRILLNTNIQNFAPDLPATPTQLLPLWVLGNVQAGAASYTVDSHDAQLVGYAQPGELVEAIVTDKTRSYSTNPVTADATGHFDIPLNYVDYGTYSVHAVGVDPNLTTVTSAPSNQFSLTVEEPPIPTVTGVNYSAVTRTVTVTGTTQLPNEEVAVYTDWGGWAKSMSQGIFGGTFTVIISNVPSGSHWVQAAGLDPITDDASGARSNRKTFTVASQQPNPPDYWFWEENDPDSDTSINGPNGFPGAPEGQWVGVYATYDDAVAEENQITYYADNIPDYQYLPSEDIIKESPTKPTYDPNQ
jgi:hypothetical protein